MKFNYDKLNKKAIYPISKENLHSIILRFVYDGKLTITKEHIYSGNMDLYKKWCSFINKVNNELNNNKEYFSIALDKTSPEGCIYGNINDLIALGYEPILVSQSLEKLPNMCNILGINPDQTLESAGLLRNSKFSPHVITLDGRIKANNGGCLEPNEVLRLFKKIDFLTKYDDHKFYDLLGLQHGESFKVNGYIYDYFDSLESFLQVCIDNISLFYDVINDPSRIIKQKSLRESKDLKFKK